MPNPHAIFFNPPLEMHALGHQFEEIYKIGLYEPYVRGKKDLTILDLGANVGLTSYYFSQFAKDIYALEPSSEHFELLSKMVAFNELTQIHPIKKALYIENGTFPFWSTVRNKTMSSLNQAVWDGQTPSEEVETITFDKLFEENNITHVDLCKLDIEGSEVEVLSSEGFKLVSSKIDLIIGEVHTWNQRNPHQIIEALKNNGFSFEAVPHDATLFVSKRL